jgi:NRPS condensation-like uncharacterized protein
MWRMVSVFELFNETCPVYVSLNCDLQCADQFRLLIGKERKYVWDKKDKFLSNYSFIDLSIIVVC